METVELHTSLRYQMETTSGIHNDVSDYLLEGRAEIIGKTFDNTDEVVLGFLKFTLIRVTLAGDDGANLFALFDHDPLISKLAEALFDIGYDDYVVPVQAEFPESFAHEDILYVREIEVLPFARGQRLGLSALHRLAKDWDGGCGLVVIDPQPLQGDVSAMDEAERQRLALGAFPPDIQSARERLIHHFGGLGFQRIASMPYLLRSPKLRQIPVDELDIRNSVFVPKALLDSLNKEQG